MGKNKSTIGWSLAIAVSKIMSIWAMVWYRALKFVTHFEYEYAQVIVDLFCENLTLVHCSVVACNYVSSFSLYLTKCVIISKLGSIMSCGLTRETRLTRHKPTPWCTRLLYCMKRFTFDGDPFTRWSHNGENEVHYERMVVFLSQEQLGYLTKYIIYWNRDLKTS